MNLTHTTGPAPIARSLSHHVPVGQEASLAALVEHVLDTHHAYTRLALREIAPQFDAVIARHAHSHPFLRELAVLYEGLAAELSELMRDEERVIGPHAWPPASLPSSEDLALMRHAHDTALRLLDRMRNVTRSYRVPRGASREVQRLFAALSALERHLRHHIHLERELLLPRLGAAR